MADLEIFLFILGDLPASENIFSVVAPASMSVSTWKGQVHVQGPLTLGKCKPADLTLWKLNVPIMGTEVDDVATWPLGQDLSGVANLMLPSYKLSDYFSSVPANSLHVIVVPPSFTDNRTRHAPVDITHSLLPRWSAWNIPLPPISALATYLQQPLRDDEKVPVMEHDLSKLVTEGSPMSLCTRGELEQLVRSSEVEEANYIWLVMRYAITLDAPDGDGTEASFVSFWDRNIRVILETIVFPSRTIRDSNRGTNTGLLRPDYGFVVRGNCVFRGEEKSPLYSGIHPKAELSSNLTWTYEPAPYVLGYYAIGSEVTLVAITATDVIELVIADLSLKTQRVKLIVYLLRLSSLLKPLANLVGHRADPELETLTRPGGKTVSIGARAILKAFQAAGHRYQATYLQAIYQNLKEKAVPNVDSPTTWRMEPTMSAVYLEPKGRNRLPGSEKEVRDAVGCILEALMVMHSEPKPMFHRDIRWPNVIQRADVLEKWFLIDWDDATFYPTRASPNLSASNHSPNVFQDGHGAEVDLWAVGKIICEAGDFVPGLSLEMMAFAKRLMEGEVTSAGQALDDLRQFRGEAFLTS